MSWQPDHPYNQLPLLPPAHDYESKPVLKACILARAALAALNQAGALPPDQGSGLTPAELINQPLIEKLLDYVNARDPYDVYIRALVELYRLPDAPVPTELKPLTLYQRPVVARVLQALQDYRGAMLVASTGLGKTVMAAHVVAYLRMENRIDR